MTQAYRKSICVNVPCREILHQSRSRLLNAFPFLLRLIMGFGFYVLRLLRFLIFLEVVAIFTSLVSGPSFIGLCRPSNIGA